MKIKKDGKYQTQDGRDVVLYEVGVVDINGNHRCFGKYRAKTMDEGWRLGQWDMSGRHWRDSERNGYEERNLVQAKEKGWIIVYLGGIVVGTFASEDEAQRYAMGETSYELIEIECNGKND